VPKVKLIDQQGDVAFNAMDTDSRWDEPCAPGDHVVTAWIPGNFLNEGLYTVDAGLFRISRSPKLRPMAAGSEVVSFNVQDPGEGGSARGRFTGQWRGVVSPILEWTTRHGS
jgi:hypothetical protein